ncbi:MAG: hypothetical protein E5W97_22905 [Mesorhizobium sp.]|nr:MAG: hypothetical protein EOS45_31180 [Mesorhizobium sp.]TJW02422.1 MAG: hypothetical protein E5W97_22905 [Mesorhizobium sp.]
MDSFEFLFSFSFEALFSFSFEDLLSFWFSFSLLFSFSFEALFSFSFSFLASFVLWFVFSFSPPPSPISNSLSTICKPNALILFLSRSRDMIVSSVEAATAEPHSSLTRLLAVRGRCV